MLKPLKQFLKNEIKALSIELKALDKKSTTIFISIAILQTVSWYYSSRLFYEEYLYNFFSNNGNADLFEFLYWFITDFVVLFIFPVLIIKYFFKEKLSGYGISLGNYKAGLLYSFLFIIIMLPLVWVATSQQSFILTYPLLERARSSWKIFFIFELVTILYLFAWEFIWRGYMLFGLMPKFGIYSIFIQMIPFVILHNGKPSLETFGSILGGLLLGMLAFRTKSIYYCVIAHVGIMFSIDLISTLRYRTNEFGIGIISFVNILKHFL